MSCQTGRFEAPSRIPLLREYAHGDRLAAARDQRNPGELRSAGQDARPADGGECAARPSGCGNDRACCRHCPRDHADREGGGRSARPPGRTCTALRHAGRACRCTRPAGYGEGGDQHSAGLPPWRRQRDAGEGCRGDPLVRPLPRGGGGRPDGGGSASGDPAGPRRGTGGKAAGGAPRVGSSHAEGASRCCETGADQCHLHAAHWQ